MGDGRKEREVAMSACMAVRAQDAVYLYTELMRKPANDPDPTSIVGSGTASTYFPGDVDGTTATEAQQA
jgi:hypothetical protein